ncbi:MAG: DUF3352 domain-containing protein [Bacteroidales bacterium]|nr:DUF3352 domain-containing protein [Bacteroidales bacterium]
MKINKKLVIISLVSLFSIIIIFFGYNLYKQFKSPLLPAINAIPLNSAMIIELNKTTEVWNKLSKKNDIWKEILTIEYFKKLNNQLNFLDSVSKTNSTVFEIIKQQKIYISAHFIKKKEIEFLYLISLPSAYRKSYVESFIKKINGEKSIVLKKDYKEAFINMVSISGYEKNLSYTVYKGVFICSFNSSLVEASIEQLDSGNFINNDISFKKVELTAGKNVDANIYLNINNFIKLISKFSLPDYKNTINILSDLNQWSELDLIVRNNELLLNGYSITNDTSKQYLNLFEQQPGKIEFTKILPYNTSLFIDFCFEDFNKYYKDYKLYLQEKKELNEFKKKIQKINTNFKTDIEKHFLPWLGNEIALVITEPVFFDITENTFAVFHAKDIKKANIYLNQLSEIARKKTANKAFISEHNEYVIKRIEIPGLLSALFGSLFKNINNYYYIMIKDYVVFANQASVLKNLIKLFYIQKTLIENPNYLTFSDNISEKSNIYLYCNIRKSLEIIRPFLDEHFTDKLDKYLSTLINFEGLAIQFSYINQMFYTNVYLKHNPYYQEINPSSWETTIDGNITGKPHFIKDHKNNKLKVIVFDENNNMYLINHIGNIIWKIPLTENPMSEVYQIDYYKNNKIQYLFNTENYIYLIDLNGEKVADYPIKLKAKATNGIAVFDYDEKKEYRLLIACEDNKIYNYDITGNIIKGWDKIKSLKTVNKTIQHLINNGKDYLIITDENGNVIITDRRGKERIRIKKDFINSNNSDFYINKTNNKGILLTSDNTGKVTYIDRNGKIQKTTFGKFSPEHYFIYKDINNDNSKDFIFLDNNKLVVFNRLKKIILEHDFNIDINTKPMIFPVSANENYIGIISDKTGEIFLFDKHGLIINSQNLTGETPFIVGSLNNDGQLNIIVGAGNIVYNYLIE